MMNKITASLLFLAIAGSAYSQEFYGLRTDNFSGSNGMLLNPATPVSGALPWDINIAAAGLSAYTNYAYIEDANTFSLAADSSEILFHNVNQVKATENMFLQLPSAFFKTGDYAFGFFITGRSAASVISDNYPPGVQSLLDVPHNVPTTIPKFDAAFLNWMEVGINGEMILQALPKGSITVGANVKFLGGFDAVNFHHNEELTFTQDSILTDITNINAEYAFTQNAGEGEFTSLNINGWGLGTDIGMYYTVNSDRRKSYYANYNWKFGAALTDLGFIHLRDEAGTYALNKETDFTMFNADLDSINDLVEFNKDGSKTIYDFAQASQTGDKFTNFLPAALNLQADYNIGKGFFVSAMLTRRISFLNENMIARANTIYLAPRYESRMFGFTTPLSLYEDKLFHVGAAARILFFTIGSDDLLSWIHKNEYNGTDLYVGIKINPFWLTNAKKDKKYSASKQLDCKGPDNPNHF